MFGLFAKPKTETIRTYQDEYDNARKQVRTLKDEIADLKQEKKITEEDIKHMVRLREEKLALEAQRKDVERAGEQAAAIAEVKDQYRDKLEKRLQKEVDSIKEMYGQILERLPKVSVRQYDSVEEKVG